MSTSTALFGTTFAQVGARRAELKDFDPAQHPRDAHGRFASTDGGDGQTSLALADRPATAFLDREGQGMLLHVAPSRGEAAYAALEANLWAANTHKPYSTHWMDDPHPEYPEPDMWRAGQPESLEQAVSTWEHTFTDSRETQAAADALLGYQSRIDGRDFDGEHAAYAVELLDAMTDHGPQGAVSPGGIATDYVESATIQAEPYPAGDLWRGVNDSDGTLREAFTESLRSGEPIAWSLASFIDGRPDSLGTMGDYLVESGGGHRDPETDEVLALNPAAEALRYANENEYDHDAVLITNGNTVTGLNLDGAYEAVVGGTFRVTAIDPSFTVMGYDDDETAGEHTVTKVTIEQVALPDPLYRDTDEYAEAHKADRGVAFIHWRDGSYRSRRSLPPRPSVV